MFNGGLRGPRSSLDVASLLEGEDEAAIADDGSLGESFKKSLEAIVGSNYSCLGFQELYLGCRSSGWNSHRMGIIFTV